jgi:hypothetical protein
VTNPFEYWWRLTGVARYDNIYFVSNARAWMQVAAEPPVNLNN